MAHRRMRVILNHAQRRVTRPRLGITARGEDFREDSSQLVVCPATGAVRLRANFDRDEFSTEGSGVFTKLALSDYTLVDNNVPAGDWKPFAFSMGMTYIQYQGENTAGVGAVTVAAYPADQGWAISVYAYSTGEDQDGILIEFGWNTSASGAAGPSVRLYLDGRLEVWRNGEKVSTQTMSGTAGYGRATQQYVLVTVERGRGRDMVLRTSTGGAATVRCDWVDPEDSALKMFPATNFWWYLPKGQATVLACPVLYETSGGSFIYGTTRAYILAEAPELGETLEDMAGSDRFTLDNAHLVGHPQGGDAEFSLVEEDGTTAFVPDGTKQNVRIKLGLKSLDSGVTSPWVWGVHAAYPRQTDLTPDEEADVTHLIDGPIRLSLPDSSEGLSAEFAVRDLAALELLAPHATETEGTPVKLELYDPDAVDPTVVWLDGELLAPETQDALDRTRSRLLLRAVDKLQAASGDKAREALPFDGMPLCQPVASGVSAVLLCLREMGLEDSEAELPDLDWRLPDVPAAGDSRAPTGEWNTAAENGDMWGDTLERLLSRAPLVVYGMRPTSTGYKFYAFEPADADAVFETLYRSVAAAQLAEPLLTELEASRLLYDGATEQRLPLEGNEVRVMGYDPARRAPLAAQAVWEESADPTIAAALRFPGWKGRRLTVEYSDPGLTTIEDCTRVCEDLYTAVVGIRSLDSYTSELPIVDGVPVWRGEFVQLDDFLDLGTARKVRTSAWSVDLLDESGLGYLAGFEQPPSRLASISGGALLGHGGSAAFEIVSFAKERVGAARRFRGWGAVESVSPADVATIPIPKDRASSSTRLSAPF